VSDPWDLYKRAYERLERAAAPRAEAALRSGAFLRPAGAALAAALRARALSDAAVELLWSSARLPTRTEQERSLDLLQRIDGRLAALELRIARLEERLDERDAER